MSETPAWQGELYDLLKNEFDVTQFSYVPDAGHRELINRSIADPDVHSVSVTTEEEGVALQCGAHLGGEESVERHGELPCVERVGGRCGQVGHGDDLWEW